MPDAPAPRPPAPQQRIDRGALERVLARAAELQGRSADSDPSEEFTEEQLIDLGKEVGLNAQNLRQALAEERTRSVLPEEEHGLIARIVGASRVAASRTVDGKPADVLRNIDAWMQREELLIVKRHHGDRIVWEPRRDFFVGLKRALKAGGRDYALSRAFEVAATTIAVDEARTHVALDADFRTHRSVAVGQIGASSFFGVAATASLLVMHVFPPLAIVPVVVAPLMGVAGARSAHNRVLPRAQLALEQLLDRLERGEPGRRGADALFGAIVAAATALPNRRI
jgi:hypothetical protein